MVSRENSNKNYIMFKNNITVKLLSTGGARHRSPGLGVTWGGTVWPIYVISCRAIFLIITAVFVYMYMLLCIDVII